LNHLIDLEILNNRYFVMRHGHSLANQQGIIVSDPENGCEQYGLSELGRIQVEQNMRADQLLGKTTIIISSDFKRARESADIAYSVLSCDTPVCLESRLRERYFGEFELSADSGYSEIWLQDAADPEGGFKGVESVNQVMARVSSVVTELEDQYTDETILLVSHGDALQILQTAFSRQDASSHRQLEHLQTAEIRQLILV